MRESHLSFDEDANERDEYIRRVAGNYGSHPDFYVNPAECGVDTCVAVNAGHLHDLCLILGEGIFDSEKARFMLCTDHVSKEWVDGVLYALSYLGIAYDGDPWVNPQGVFRLKRMPDLF